MAKKSVNYTNVSKAAFVFGDQVVPPGGTFDLSEETPGFANFELHAKAGRIAPTEGAAKAEEQAPAPKTVEEIKAALDGKGVKYPPGAAKADLQALLDAS